MHKVMMRNSSIFLLGNLFAACLLALSASSGFAQGFLDGELYENEYSVDESEIIESIGSTEKGYIFVHKNTKKLSFYSMGITYDWRNIYELFKERNYRLLDVQRSRKYAGTFVMTDYKVKPFVFRDDDETVYVAWFYIPHLNDNEKNRNNNTRIFVIEKTDLDLIEAYRAAVYGYKTMSRLRELDGGYRLLYQRTGPTRYGFNAFKVDTMPQTLRDGWGEKPMPLKHLLIASMPLRSAAAIAQSLSTSGECSRRFQKTKSWPGDCEILVKAECFNQFRIERITTMPGKQAYEKLLACTKYYEQMMQSSFDFG